MFVIGYNIQVIAFAFVSASQIQASEARPICGPFDCTRKMCVKTYYCTRVSPEGSMKARYPVYC